MLNALQANLLIALQHKFGWESLLLMAPRGSPGMTASETVPYSAYRNQQKTSELDIELVQKLQNNLGKA